MWRRKIDEEFIKEFIFNSHIIHSFVDKEMGQFEIVRGARGREYALRFGKINHGGIAKPIRRGYYNLIALFAYRLEYIK